MQSPAGLAALQAPAVADVRSRLSGSGTKLRQRAYVAALRPFREMILKTMAPNTALSPNDIKEKWFGLEAVLHEACTSAVALVEGIKSFALPLQVSAFVMTRFPVFVQAITSMAEEFTRNLSAQVLADVESELKH